MASRSACSAVGALEAELEADEGAALSVRATSSLRCSPASCHHQKILAEENESRRSTGEPTRNWHVSDRVAGARDLFLRLANSTTNNNIKKGSRISNGLLPLV
jgi:hypothetical protein